MKKAAFSIGMISLSTVENSPSFEELIEFVYADRTFHVVELGRLDLTMSACSKLIADRVSGLRSMHFQ